MQQHVEISLSGELTEGEELIWSGSPNPHNKSIVSPNRPILIVGISMGIYGSIFVVVGIFARSLVADPAFAITTRVLVYTIGGTLILIAIMLIVIFGGQRVATRNTNNALYAITNRRVIIIRAENHSHKTIDSFGKSDIGQIRRQELPDGSGNLIFACRTPVVHSTSNNSSHQGGNGNESFMHIDNVRKVEHLLISALK